VPYTSETLLTHELPSEAIDSLVEAVGAGSGSQLASVELRHGGGALSRAPEGAGALATLPGTFLAFGVGFVPMPEAMAPNRAWLGAFKAALEPYDAGRYFNFVEESFDITKIFSPEVLNRLREVKQRYDPDNLFQSNHPVTA
jgi:Berberine and berberine like